MKTVRVNVDLIDLYNDGEITDEMLVALLFGNGVVKYDGVTPEYYWKRRLPMSDGFESLIKAYSDTPLDPSTTELFAAVQKWLRTHQ